MVIDVFRNAADAVAAHRAAAAVGIVHVHREISLLGRLDQNQPVGSDSEMAVADFSGDPGRVFYFFLRAVDIDIVIADAVHFSKVHALSSVILTSIP